MLSPWTTSSLPPAVLIASGAPVMPCVLAEGVPVVVTVEEGTLEGGFGSAVLEAANAVGLDARNVVRLGLPDRFIEHAERAELLADLGLDVTGICRTVRQALEKRAKQFNREAFAMEE